MNKSAEFKLEFFFKRFGPGPSSVELPVRRNRCKVYIRQKLGFLAFPRFIICLPYVY